MLSKDPGFTYDLVEGLSSRRSCSTASPPNPEPPDGGILPLLGDRPSQPSEVALFFLNGEGILASPSPLSSGEEMSISPDAVSNLPPERRSSRVFLLSTLRSSTSAWYGAGTSILVNTGSAESSGRGAGHLIYSAFFIQPWKKMVCLVSYHMISDYEVFGGRVLIVVSGWLQSRPVSSVVSRHCFRFPKNNFHIPSCLVPKKC